MHASRAISSPPKALNQNYFTSPDFEDLSAVLDRVLSVACETVAPTPAPTQPPVEGKNIT